MHEAICLFAGNRTMQRKLRALEVNVFRMRLKALSGSLFRRASTGNVNGLGPFRGARKHDELIVGNAYNASADRSIVLLALADVLNDALAQCSDKSGMVREDSYIAVHHRDEDIACHNIAHRAVGRCELKMDLICHGTLPVLTALCKNLVDRAAHEERLLGQVVAVAAEDGLEAADGILELYIRTLDAGEVLGNMERL